jgi:predicted TIM-barrel fold metal-dependent hydrolase
MSDLSPLSGVKRKLDFGGVRAAFDPGCVKAARQACFIHLLRLVLSGALDRHPRLKLIIGHMGEMLPMMMARADEMFTHHSIEHLQRPISRTILDQVWLTTSGMFSEPPFNAAKLTFGIDRIMFSVDYPYSSNAKGRSFLDRLPLARADMDKFSHGNADALLKLNGTEVA